MIDGATYLITNEYEARLTEQKTGWSSEAEIAARVTHRVITQRQGRRDDRVSPGVEPIHVGVAKVAKPRRSRPASAMPSARASWPVWPPGWATSGAPRSARSSPRTSSRRSALRSTS
jgi:adenosine kinase